MVKPWDTATIGDFLEFKNGLNKGKEFFGYGTPIVNYTDVYKKRGLKRADIRGRVCLTPDEIHRFDVRKNDVFFTRTSETPDEVGMSSVLLEEVENGVFSGFVLRGRPKNGMFVPEYCKYCFSTEAVRNAIITGCTYTTRALTNGKQLSAIEIPVPPNPEQEAIATALTDIDTLIANLEKLIAKKKAIKQGAMQELLTGKRRLPGFEGKWKDESMDAYLDFQVGFPFSSVYFNDGSDGLRLVKNRDLKSDDQIYFTSEVYSPEYIVENGDILVGMDGDFLPCRWQKGKALLNQRVGRLLPKKNMAGLFAYYALQKPLMELENGTGATTVKHLSHGDIKKLIVPMPPTVEEQMAIAEVLSDMDSEIKKHEQNLAKYRLIKQGMMSELLTGRIRLI